MRPLLNAPLWLRPFLLFLFIPFGALYEGPVQRGGEKDGKILPWQIRGVKGIPEPTTVADIKRFVQHFRTIKRAIPNYYSSFTHKGDIIYFLELRKLDISVLDANNLTERDMEQHMHFVRQIVWDCLISHDIQPVMYILVDLNGIQLMSMWTRKNRVLTQLLRSLRDKTFTRRFHRVQVVAVSSNRLARTIVEMKRHKFPPGSDVQVYSSFDEFIRENKGITTDVLPKSHGGTANLDLPREGLEFIIAFFVEEILARHPSALYECSESSINTFARS